MEMNLILSDGSPLWNKTKDEVRCKILPKLDSEGTGYKGGIR
jgi:hypothetical protein